MRLALERHATSKLPNDAIDRVTSFGFRGEALPSIASVSRLTLESRVRGDDGWRIEIDHGEMFAQAPAALPPGTRIKVEGLFDKVPARRKFLRSPRAEYSACLDAVKRLAMARSDVGFALEHDGRRILTLQPSDAPARVAALLTHELDRHGIGIDCAREGMRLTGVISLPTFNRGVADQQFLFVNSGPVKDRLLVGRAARRLSRPHRPRPPPDRRSVPRGAARRGRRECPPGQDRSPVSRPCGRARAHRRRLEARARRGKPAQRRPRAGGGAGDVDEQRNLR